jgi:hypothetical protein
MADDAKNSWHLARGGEKFGPYTSQQLAVMGKEGRITSDMVIWRQGMEKWQPVSKVKGLRVTPLAPEPPPAPAAPVVTVAVTPAPFAAPMPMTGHVTVEKTKKALKVQQLLGLLAIVVGIAMVGIGISSRDPGSSEPSRLVMMGSPLVLLGLVWRVITRMRIWWHHG